MPSFLHRPTPDAGSWYPALQESPDHPDSSSQVVRPVHRSAATTRSVLFQIQRNPPSRSSLTVYILRDDWKVMRVRRQRFLFQTSPCSGSEDAAPSVVLSYQTDRRKYFPDRKSTRLNSSHVAIS